MSKSAKIALSICGAVALIAIAAFFIVFYQKSPAADSSASSPQASVNYDPSKVAYIKLSDSGITVENSDAIIDGSTVSIVSGGEYDITGEMANGRIAVVAQKTDAVHLFLSGVNLTSQDYAPIYIDQAESVVITLAEGTENFLEDAAVYSNLVEEEPDGAIFSKDDLTINGSGTLKVTSNYLDAIVSKDVLAIEGGNIAVVANGHGMRGTDSIIVSGGNLSISANEDGLHSNGSISFANANIALAVGDDAMHADLSLTIDSGEILITACYEGIESTSIVINDGDIEIIADDDGINGAGGADASGLATTGRGGMFSGSSGTLEVNGGTISILSGGDGIDINGAMVMTGGSITAHSPSSNNNAVDTDGGISMTGGEINVDGIVYTAENIASMPSMDGGMDGGPGGAPGGMPSGGARPGGGGGAGFGPRG